MSKSSLFFAVIILLFNSCNSLPKEKITVIGNYTLGCSAETFSSQLDSLKTTKERFLTKLVVNGSGDLFNTSNYITLYYTSIFNFTGYEQRYSQTLGLFYPMSLTGTDYINGLVVLLGHRTTPALLGDATSLTVSTNVIRQDVSKDVINQIETLFRSKYGKPELDYKSKINNFYVIQSDLVEGFSDTSREGEELKWRTEYYDVTLFKGLPSYDSRFDTEKRGYKDVIMHFGGYDNFPPLKADPTQNEMECNSYAYILYKLNEKAIAKLHIDKKSF